MLKDRIIFVTGVDFFIGEGIVEKLLENGAKVFGVGESDSSIISNPNFTYLKLDIYNPKALKNAAKIAKETYGKIDGLVNAIWLCGLAEGLAETDEARLKEMYERNVFIPYYAIQALVPYLNENEKATIVNISTNLSTKAVPNSVAYPPARAALNKLSENLAIDLGPKIRVNVVAFGYIHNPGRDRDSDYKEQLRSDIVNRYPLKRWGTPTDVANAICFLISDLSGFTTGEIIRVSGGGHLR